MQTLTLVKPVVLVLPTPRNYISPRSSHLSRQSTFIGVACFPTTPKFPNLRCSCKPVLAGSIFQCPRGVSLISETSDGTPLAFAKIPEPRKTSMTPRAAKEEPLFPPYPEMTEKPKWWWRSLACLPYMMPLHQIMLYGASTYHIHLFFENNEYLAHPFFWATSRLPDWVWMVYCSAAFFGIVRRKEFPHFFRFHLLTGMLLEICLQILFAVTSWFPLGHIYGWMTKPVFSALAFAFLFTVVKSTICSLVAMYPDIPFVSDAVYMLSTLP